MCSMCGNRLNVIITSLHKKYLTDSAKIKLPSVDIFTYGCSLKVS